MCWTELLYPGATAKSFNELVIQSWNNDQQRYLKDNYDTLIIQDFLQFAPVSLSYTPYSRLSSNFKIQRNSFTAQDAFFNPGQSKSYDYLNVSQTSQTAVS